MFSVQKAIFCNERAIKYTLSQFRWMGHHIRFDKFTKRGLILDNMVSDKDKRKNWHFNLKPNAKPKCRNVFEQVHRPARRRNVLNSLFVRNITDVVSTGDVAGDILGYGIEITGVKISPCFKILNVFWQTPVKHDGSAEEIAEKLSIAAPRIRAELISRNVMGRVPMIYFLRDGTNAKIAAFEEAMAKLVLPADSAIVPDDSFCDDIYKFKKNEIPKKKDIAPKVENEEKELQGIPITPPDMKSDVFGLQHDVMMEKIILSKKKVKQPNQSAVITTQMLEEGDLFSKIPGVCFQRDIAREQIIKNFQIERRKLLQKQNFKLSKDDFKVYEEDDENDYEQDSNLFEEDFVEEDNSTDKF